ncbi:hypothetical protein HY933_02250 [Candidatus Falkowbacteria bacterium]|nr:hypothetical protein [Candidatus Falkowbacteria bacterium]
MPKLGKTLLIDLIVFSFLITPVLAADFNPNSIITEELMRDRNALNQNQIQTFLESKEGTLDTYQTISQGKDQNGNPIAERAISAAEAFFEVAQRWNISPKFLLVLVQKEMSLVTHPNPEPKRYDWATGYAVCDTCSLEDPAIQRWRGFYKQINSAAAQFDYYLGHINEFTYQPSQTYTIDDTLVTPDSVATAAMYNYTPHLHGNQNFNSIWNTWFGDNAAPQIIKYPYPDGSLVQVAGDQTIWYIQYGTRRPIKSKMALITRFNEINIITISQTDLNIYPEGWPINLANYSLVRSSTGQLYLIVDDEKRPIVSLEVFKKIGWNPEEVEDVSNADLDNFFLGDDIDASSVYPQGVLAQDTKSGGIYYIKDGIKYPLWSKEIMQVNYPGRKLIKLAPKELATYPTEQPVLFKEGTLIKSAEYPEVYAVSNGKRRWIPDEATFIGLGYHWGNIITTSYKVVALHPLGETVTR